MLPQAIPLPSCSCCNTCTAARLITAESVRPAAPAPGWSAGAPPRPTPAALHPSNSSPYIRCMSKLGPSIALKSSNTMPAMLQVGREGRLAGTQATPHRAERRVAAGLSPLNGSLCASLPASAPVHHGPDLLQLHRPAGSQGVCGAGIVQWEGEPPGVVGVAQLLRQRRGHKQASPVACGAPWRAGSVIMQQCMLACQPPQFLPVSSTASTSSQWPSAARTQMVSSVCTMAPAGRGHQGQQIGPASSHTHHTSAHECKGTRATPPASSPCPVQPHPPAGA